MKGLGSIFCGTLFCSAVAFAQHVGVINPSRGMTPPAGAYQYGNILFPGGTGINQSHAARLGASVAGYPPYPGARPGVGPGGGPGVGPGGGYAGGRNRTVIVPYAYPVAYPDYGYGYGMQQAAPPNVTVVVPQQPTPSVIINQNYGPDQPAARTSVSEERESSGLRVWNGPSVKPAPETSGQYPADGSAAGIRSSVADEKATIYLIALKDSSLRSAIGYWVEDGTLHYVTPQSSVNHVTLDMVDRELSEQLNRERNLDFDLKSATSFRR